MRKRFFDALPALLFAVAGVVVCVMIEDIHAETMADPTYVSFCKISDNIDCQSVLTSPYAYLAGVTVSLWGLLFYLAAAAGVLGAVFLDRARRREAAALLVFALSILGLLFSVYMAVVSFFVLQTVCLMCTALYVASIGLFASAWRLRSTLVPPPPKGPKAKRGKEPSRAERDRKVILAAVSAGAVFVVIGLVPVFWGESAGVRLDPDEIRARKPDVYQWFKSRPVVDVPRDGHALGPDDAPVTIVGFSDFGCPHCARLDESLRGLIRAGHPDLRIVFRHFPLNSECNPAASARFHPEACLAAMASECAAEQGEFWAYQHVLFANQGAFRRTQLVEYARSVDLDVAAFEACLESDRMRSRVVADAELGAELGVQSTPTIFLNGRRIEGAPKGEVLLDAITLAREESAPSAP